MKKKYIFVLSLISFLIISCSNLMDAREETPADSTPAAYTVSGKLVTEYESNVGPRSAFPANNINLALYTTIIYYKSSPTATERTLCGTTTDSSFELKLPSLGTYYLEAESYRTSDGTETVTFKTTSPVELTLTEDNPSKNNVRMLLHIVVEEFDEDNTPNGYIKLRIKFVPEIKRITRGYVYGSEIAHEDGILIENDIWEYVGLYALPYTFVFKFFNAEGVLVYQCYESVTLFPGETTDTWVNNGNAEYFSTEIIDGKKTVVMNITQECLDNFALTNFYVDPTVTDSGNGSYFAPVKTLKEAVEKCVDSSKNYTINVKGTVNVDQGFTVSKNITIQKAPDASSAKIQYSSLSDCLFSVSASNTLKISNIDIEGPDTASSSSGAAIFNHGQLYLTNVNLSKFKSNSNGGCLANDGDGNIFITGGSIKGCEGSNGGAIYNEGKDIKIKDCTINKCKAASGGAIYNSFDNVRITLEGNTVIGEDTGANATNESYGNHASSDGGAIYMSDGTLYLTENTVIAKNYSASAGGGLYLAPGAKVYLQDNASIKNCATSSSGGGIYTAGTLEMSGGACVEDSNDIYLDVGAKINAKTLTANLAANITFESSSQIAKGLAKVIDTTNTADYEKFTVVGPYEIVTSGEKAGYVTPVFYVYGGVTASGDGSITSPKKQLSVAYSTVKANGIAIIYVAGTTSEGAVTNIDSGDTLTDITVKQWPQNKWKTAGYSGNVPEAVIGNGTMVTSDSLIKIASGKTVLFKDIKLNGNSVAHSNTKGGGIYNDGTLTLENVTVENFVLGANSYGGGIYNTGTLTINDNVTIGKKDVVSAATITDYSNKATSGAGIYSTGKLIFNGSDIHISYNAAVKNDTDAGARGGGLYLSNTATLEFNEDATKKVEIHHNFVFGNGGGIYLGASEFTLPGNCIISYNRVEGQNGNSTGIGGGIYVLRKATLNINGAEIQNNYAQYGGGGIALTCSDSGYGGNGAKCTIYSGIVAGNTAGSGKNGISTDWATTEPYKTTFINDGGTVQDD